MAPHPSPKAQAIVDAAASLIEQSGIDAATVRAIADRASVSPATIYNLFGSRDAVLDALSDTVLEELELGAVDTSGTTYSRAAAVVDRLIAVLEQRPALYRPLVAHRTTADLVWSGPRRERSAAVARLNLEIGVMTGEIRDDIDLDTGADLLVDAFENAQARWAIEELDAVGFGVAARSGIAVIVAGLGTPDGRTAAEPGLPRTADAKAAS